MNAIEFAVDPTVFTGIVPDMISQNMIKKVDTITGSTLVAAHNGKESGQEIPHVHVHLIPRSKNDGAGPVHSMFGKNTITKEQTEQAYNAIRSA